MSSIHNKTDNIDNKRARLLVLTALFLLMTSITTASLLKEVDGERRKVFLKNETVDIKTNVSRTGNYTFRLYNPAGKIVKEEKMDREYHGTYHKLGNQFSIPFNGKGEIEIIRRDSEGIVYTTTQEKLQVAEDKPSIFEWEVLNSHPRPGDNLTVVFNISDSENDIETTYITKNGSKFPGRGEGSDNNMRPFSTDREYFETFETNYTVEEPGEHEVTVTAEDSSGNLDTQNISYKVYENTTDSGGSHVDVSVSKQCSIVLRNFEAPGIQQTGYFNLIGKNKTGTFTAEIYNDGNLDANVTMDLNVTKENSTISYSLNERVDTVLSYEPENFSIPINYSEISSEDYVKTFTANKSSGPYAGRAYVNYTCKHGNQTINKDFMDFSSFVIMNATGGVGEEGDMKTNQTIPADANRTGEESDQYLEGNLSEPGSTPEPDPDPIPELSIEMRSLNRSAEASRGETVNSHMRIENWHSSEIENISISATTERFNADWESSEIRIDRLEGNQTLNKSILITPTEDVAPGEYYVPVVARTTGNRALDVEYFNVNVKKEVFTPRIDIKEMPEKITIQRNSNKTIPLLIENTGSRNLTNISTETLNINGLGKVEEDTISRLEINETGSLSINFKAGDEIGEGEITAVVASEEGAYSYGDMNLIIEEEDIYVPEEFRVPLVATVWTVVLILYAVFTRLYRLESPVIKIPYLILILGEVTLILYLATDYYGISTALLPF